MSALRSVVIAAIATFSFSGTAFARDAVFTARLEAPTAQSQVIAQNSVWSCAGDTCRARVSHGTSVRACRQFAREVGARVLAYGPEGRELNAEEIARCNGDAPATVQAAN